jgi:hypothetical protein
VQIPFRFAWIFSSSTFAVGNQFQHHLQIKYFTTMKTTKKTKPTNEVSIETTIKMKQMEKQIAKQELIIAQAEQLMRKLLFEWLPEETQQHVLRYMKYYYPEGRQEMYYAMLRYVIEGKKSRFKNGAAQWHFRLFCEEVDEAQYTPEMHEHWIFLWRKIGVFTSPSAEEPAVRPFDQEW